MYVLISHPGVDNQAVVTLRAATAYARRGWQLEEVVAAPAAAPDEGPREMKLPRKSDSTASWRTYAVAVGGLTVPEAFAKGRDELVDMYAPAAKPAPTTTATATKES